MRKFFGPTVTTAAFVLGLITITPARAVPVIAYDYTAEFAIASVSGTRTNLDTFEESFTNFNPADFPGIDAFLAFNPVISGSFALDLAAPQLFPGSSSPAQYEAVSFSANLSDGSGVTTQTATSPRTLVSNNRFILGDLFSVSDEFTFNPGLSINSANEIPGAEDNTAFDLQRIAISLRDTSQTIFNDENQPALLNLNSFDQRSLTIDFTSSILSTDLDTNEFFEDAITYTAFFGLTELSVAGDNPQDNPLLPDAGDDPADGFDFTIDVASTDETIFIDPTFAVGYDYSVLDPNGPLFTSVLVPDVLPGGDGEFTLVVDGQTFNLASGIPFDFLSELGASVDAFSILDIAFDESIDPSDPLGFVTGLTFDQTGMVQVNQSPVTLTVTSVPEPGALALFGFGLAGLAGMRRQSRKVG